MKSEKYIVVFAISLLIAAITSDIWVAKPSVSQIIVDQSSINQNITEYSSANGIANQSDPLNETVPPMIKLIIDHAGGGFTSLQADANNKTWITTGDWDLVSEPLIGNRSETSTVQFNATIDMVGTDNSGGHEHVLSEFNLTSSSLSSSSDGSEIVFNGTASIETDVGLYSDVPISVKIIDDSPAIVTIDTQTNEIEPQWIPGGGIISVLIDERVEDHFGSTAVYGNVRKE